MPTSIELKDKVLNHARSRFFREGFAKISVDELTSELGMSKKTFYQAFESKDQLIEEIVTRQISEVDGRMEHILSESTNSIQKLGAIIRFMGGMVGAISKATLSDMQRHQPHQWNRIQRFRQERLGKTLTRLFEQGVHEGYIRKSANVRIFILAYLGAVEAVMQPGVLSNESFSAREAVEAIMDIYFRGVLTQEAQSHLNELHNPTISQSA